MANYAEMSRGIADLKIYVLTGDTPGSAIDVPGVQALEWSVESDSEELRGDNQVLAVVRDAKTLTGTIRTAMTNLDAMAAMIGGTVTSTGTTPNVVDTLEVGAASDAKYIKIVGQTPGLGGGAYRVTIHKALVTSGPGGSLADGEFSIPEFEFSAAASASGNLMSHAQYETLTAIA